MPFNLAQWIAENEQPKDAKEKTASVALIRNARIALLRSGLKAEEINIEKLPGNIVGKVEAMKITVDPVVFRDLKFAHHTFEHEKSHKQGIASEAIAELIAASAAGDSVVPEYVSAVNKLKLVTDVVGWQTALDLYQKESYGWLFKIFVANSLKKGATYQNCVKIFETAFPELEVKVSKN